MRDIIYIGNSDIMAKYIMTSDLFRLKGIICQKEKITCEMTSFVEKNNVSICYVIDGETLEKSILQFDSSNAVMYDFGIIIPKKIIDRVDIFNFHPGSLKNNRGSSPINWTILLGEKETEMSLYRISEKIDLGLLISVCKCMVGQNDTPSLLRGKLEKNIPHMLKELNEFLDGKIRGETISRGEYRRRIVEADYTIDLTKDTCSVIKAKIRSQDDYRGAVFWENDKKHYIKNISSMEKILNKKMEDE
jgi:methionyl-tRNA formyltransferase